MRKRSNLAIRTNAHVLRLEIQGRRVTGVRARIDGREELFTAAGEVILTAGAIQSPQILELSGIGNPDVLAGAGVAISHALPGVGANYVDHFCTRMNWRVKLPITLNEQTRWRLALAVLNISPRGGHRPWNRPGAWFSHPPGLEGPDAQYFFMHASYANAAERKLDRLPGMTIGVTQLRPESRGTIHIRSNDPNAQPSIRPNFLAAAEDRRCMVEAMKMARDIVSQKPMDPYRAEEMSPGPECQTDADWLAFARENGQTIYHAAGTCRMGQDKEAVVDPQLRLRGLQGLRVADASVMPSMVSGNTQAAVFMIAEKAADLILQDRRT